MKTLKKSFLILLVLALTVCLFACGGGGDEPCKEHVDSDENGVCDKCNETIDNGGGGEESSEVALIKDGKPTFQFVIENGVSSSVNVELEKIAMAFLKLGSKVDVVADKESTVKDCEILIGNIQTRGDEYKYDYHNLGPKGHAIKIVGNKIIIAAGSEDKLIDIIRDLKEDILGLTTGVKELEDVSVKSEDCYEIFQDKKDFRFSSFSIGGVDAKDHVIITKSTNSAARATADAIQNFFYKYSGYWLEIVSINNVENTDNAIVITILEDDGKGDGYEAYVKGTSLFIETEFANRLQETTVNMLDQKLALYKGDVKIDTKFSFKKDVRNLYYSKFCEEKGITLDTSGKVNAYEGIKATHEYANQHGHTVNADSGAKYLITETGGQPIVIKTNVKWGKAQFIFDDRNLVAKSPSANGAVFRVASDYTPITLDANSDLVKKINEAGGIKKDEINESLNFFGYEPGYKAMIIPFNENHRVYIRYGINGDKGAIQNELIIVDEKGNIDPLTPFLLDYTAVTKVEVRRVDDKSITIDGGVITTRANQARSSYSTNFNRNILIERSNTVIKNLVHKITDEGDVGTCYSGFFSPSYTNNLLVENCVFQAHRWYYDESIDANGNKTFGSQMGTYEIGGAVSNALYYKNCSQSNFFDPNGNPTKNWYDPVTGEGAKNNKGEVAGIWGVMGTNLCKNITYDNCTLNRFDAHAGVVNASIINNSKVIEVNLIGGGTALIKDSTIYNDKMIKLRDDYGSAWNGDIQIINAIQVTGAKEPLIIYGKWYNHFFGYTTHLPHTVVLDGYTLQSTAADKAETVYIFSSYEIGANDVTGNMYGDKENKNPLVICQKIIIKNRADGTPKFMAAPADSFFANNITVTEEEDE